VSTDNILPESVLSEVTVGKTIASLGCLLVVWSDLIRSTDPNEFYTPFMDAADEMVVNAEVLLHILESLSQGQKNKVIVLPPHIGAIIVQNPLAEMNERDAKKKIKASRSASGDDDDHNTDVPF